MLVIVVSECVHAAWDRTKTIVDAYLERAGERTWRGRLTEEGLKKLRDELSAAASRHTSVAASVVHSRRRFELEWIVGSGRPFGPDGQCTTYGGHAYDRYFDTPVQHPPLYAALDAVVELAGLCHDLGKANLEFQDKLKTNGRSNDTVRHEILSSMIFVRTMRELGQHWGSASEQQLGDALSVAIKEPVRFCRFDQPIDLTPVDLAIPLRIASWLIATHHRLPDCEPPKKDQSVADSGGFKLSEHANSNKLVGPCAIDIDHRLLAPDLVAAISRTLAKVAVAPKSDCLDWGVPTTLGRLALILADRFVSRAVFDQNWHQGVRPSNHGLLANNEQGQGLDGIDSDRTEAHRPKQTLEEHLLKVGQHAPVSLSDIADLCHEAPALPSAGLPRSLRGRSPAAYDWQNAVVDTIRRCRRKDAGFFGEAMAGTGTGKTIACVKALAAADSALRYTLCLPLRSLTMQAGADYRDDLGLGQADVATVIGSAEIRDLYERRNRESGSESAVGKTGLLLDKVDHVSGKDVFKKLPNGLWKHLDGDFVAARFLATPIVVSTIDQIMAVADARKTSYLVPALRLASADLILDEIDSYDAEDQVAIGRLVCLAGVFGRKVIVASATILSPHAQGLYAAYSSGYSAYCRFHGIPLKIDVGLFSDSGQQATVFPGENDGAYEQTASGFRTAMVTELNGRAPIRRVKILPRLDNLNIDSYFGLIPEALSQLHNTRHVVDQRTKKRVSVILIRFAHVRSCVYFAQWLASAYQHRRALVGTNLKILPYHAGFPLLMRDRIEVFLDDALKRKGRDRFLENPRVRCWLGSSQEVDNILIVVSTSVEEIGRDHDFDGAVIEPTSEHSIIQCAGRVDRHRQRCPDGPNVFLLPTPMRVIRGSGRVSRPFSKPGPEGISKVLHQDYDLRSYWIDELCDFPDHIIDARNRLCEGSQSPLNKLEHRVIRDHMMSTVSYFSLYGYIDHNRHYWLARNHADTMRFRRGTLTARFWFNPVKSHFIKVDDSDNEQSADAIIRRDDRMSLGRCQFIDLSPDIILKEEQKKDESLGENDRLIKFARKYLQVSLPVYSDSSGKFVSLLQNYHPDVGIFSPLQTLNGES